MEHTITVSTPVALGKPAMDLIPTDSIPEATFYHWDSHSACLQSDQIREFKQPAAGPSLHKSISRDIDARKDPA